jgi:hypothetical protein
MKDTNQKRVPMRRRAQAAAEFLADKIWGNPGGERTPSSPSESPGKIVLDDLQTKTCEFNLQDPIMAIRKMKRRKTPGPDDVPIEFFKELQEPALYEILDLINYWYTEKHVPRDVLKARVVLIFKNGDKADLSNYRPISLLNNVYKIYAATLQKRLADGLEPHLQPTQYGFRAKKRNSGCHTIHTPSDR